VIARLEGYYLGTMISEIYLFEGTGKKPQVPAKFIKLLRGNAAVRKLWCSPDENNDTSMHDWKLGCACIQAGIMNLSEVATILMHNPFGKFQRDRRYDYIQTTVSKLMMENGTG